MDHIPTTIELASQIVAAYVGRNPVAPAELPGLIGEVYRALEAAAASAANREESGEARPPVAVKKTITPDYLICLEDGKKFKSLKRHLRTQFGLTPEQYREKWGLPHDYPMVAPNYASSRSALAKNMGLGQRRGK
ncbi:MAG: MucR family transcriptional regulator [Aestuariivirga sp.]|uniref:MucR family transcriptional regulator n=1 Tax=Aestuariivirga sp. TaxID=2650926 RepID=UPI0038D16638